jgi:hypothetical protein
VKWGKRVGMQVKQEIIEKNERGVKIRAVVSEYCFPISATSTLTRQKDKYEATSMKDTVP